MKLRTHSGKWYVTDGDQTVTFNSSTEAWTYIFDTYKYRKEAKA